MKDYKKSKIYKILSPSNPELVYYGSTILDLDIRLNNHTAQYKSKKSGSSINKIVCYDDAIIQLVENYPCNNRKELLNREGYYIQNNTCVNKRIAGRDKIQYRIDNKEHILNYAKEHYKNNKKKYQDYYKNKPKKIDENYQFYIKNKDEIKKYINNLKNDTLIK